MTVGTEVVAGVSEVSKAEIDMSSCQDLAKVGADCNGPKLDVVNVNGNGNVRHDPDGSYLFISDTREVTTDDPNYDKNSDAEVKPVVDSEVKSALEVQFGEVGVENGRTIQSLAEGESHCVVSLTNKDVALHGKPNGEVLDLATTGTVEQPNGTAVEEHENAPLGCQVEDQVETGSSPNQNSQIAVEANTDGELGESLGSVIFSPKASYSSDENVKSVEINNLHSAPELGEMQESIIMSEVDQSNVESNAELGESRESVIKSPEAGDLSDGSVKLAEQNNIHSNAELGEIKISQNVVLVAAGCELSEVVVGEGKSLEQSEVESFREVEESLKSQFRITRCVDSVSHQHDKEEDKKEDNVEKTTDLDVNVDVTVKLANDTDPLEEKATVQKGLNEFINVTLENAASLPSPVCVISQNKIGKMPVECSGSLDDGRVVEQELAISVNSQTVLVQEDEVANLVKETCTPWDTKTACNSDSDTIKVAQTKHGDESQQAAELTGNPQNAESLHSTTNDDDDENEIGNVPVKSCGSFLDSPDVTASDQGLVVAENIGSGLVEEHEAEEVVLQTETAAGPVSDQNKISQIDLLSECIRFPELNGSPGNAESVPCVPVEIDGSIDDNKVTKEKTGELPVESDGSIDDTKVVLQTEIAAGPVSDQNEISQLDHLSECVRFPELNGSPENAESVLGVPVDSDGSIDDTKVTKEKTGELPVESDGSIYDTNVEMAVENSNLRSTAGSIKSDTKVDNGLNGMSGCPANYVSFETKIEFGSFGPAAMVFTSHCDNMLTKSQVSKGESECSHNQNIYNHLNPQIRKCAGMKSDSDTQSSSAISSSDMSAKDATVPTDAVEEYVLGGEAGTKPFKFLIRFPRFDDQELREKLRDAKLLVDDKTRQRDAVGDEIHRKKANLNALDSNWKAAKSKERAAWSLVNLKRQEIDSVQVVMNRVKNAMSVDDIDNRIYSMEHMIEHETLPLKEEKLLIREIKQLKKLRDELSFNMGTQDEVQQALDQRDHIEGCLKILKKELDGLKSELLEAKSAASLSKEKYDAESKKLKELRVQYKAANAVRQEAYAHFKELNDKINYFQNYKKDAKMASDYALSGDREALHRLCVHQVETVMERWNKNDEFRKEYVRCNMRSTLRRLKTLDGRSLGPDEEAPVLPIYVDERVDRHLSSPYKATSPTLVSTLVQERPMPPVKGEVADGQSMEVAEPKNQMLKSKTSVKPIPGSRSETVSSKVETEAAKAKENLQTREDLELARKVETARKEEIDAKLKEQRRLEEKAKAQEALERKKRNAEKAQIRAELRAQKEAEQKEKEREKRLRKKEKKKSAVAADDHNGNIDGETTPALELQTETTKQSGSKESVTTVTRPKKTSHYTKQSKTKAIPPPLRNRGKRRLKEVLGWIVVIVIVLFIIFGGEGGAFGSRKS